jgi:hypothetical protein
MQPDLAKDWPYVLLTGAIIYFGYLISQWLSEKGNNGGKK